MENQTAEQISKQKEKTLIKLNELYFFMRRDPSLEIPVTDEVRNLFTRAIRQFYMDMDYIPYSYDKTAMKRYCAALENLFADANLKTVRGSMAISSTKNLIYAVSFLTSQLIYLDGNLHVNVLTIK